MKSGELQQPLLQSTTAIAKAPAEINDRFFTIQQILYT